MVIFWDLSADSCNIILNLRTIHLGRFMGKQIFSCHEETENVFIRDDSEFYEYDLLKMKGREEWYKLQRVAPRDLFIKPLQSHRNHEPTDDEKRALELFYYVKHGVTKRMSLLQSKKQGLTSKILKLWSGSVTK